MCTELVVVTVCRGKCGEQQSIDELFVYLSLSQFGFACEELWSPVCSCVVQHVLVFSRQALTGLTHYHTRFAYRRDHIKCCERMNTAASVGVPNCTSLHPYSYCPGSIVRKKDITVRNLLEGYPVTG